MCSSGEDLREGEHPVLCDSLSFFVLPDVLPVLTAFRLIRLVAGLSDA